jgi:hypothetical protein
MPDFVHAAVAGYLAGLAPADDDVLSAVRARSAKDDVPACGRQQSPVRKAGRFSEPPSS